MAERSYPLNDTLYLAEDAQLWHSTRTKGVFSSDSHFNVRVVSGMDIVVDKGIAWLKFNEFENAVYCNDGELEFTVETADPALPRIDRAVIRWDKIQNKIYMDIKKGTPASKPVAPELTINNPNYWELSPFDINVPAGTISLSEANIIDNRLNEKLCGIMRDGVTGIPTQQLYDAWWNWFNELKTNAENQSNDFIIWLNQFKQQNIDEVANWLTDFKQTSENLYNTWFNNMQSDANSLFSNWYSNFTNTSETDFNTWFENLQSTLGENEAANLFKKIDDHEKTKIYNSEVHGFRVLGNELQAEVAENYWVTIYTIGAGLTWQQKDDANLSWLEWDTKDYTFEELDNMIGGI